MANNESGDNETGDTQCFSLKVVLVGDSAVGKTSIALRFVHQDFHPFPEPTVGASFWSRNVILPNQKRVQIRVWDTAGQEKYHSLAPLYFRGANVAVLIFDLSKMYTWEALKKWVRELKTYGNSDMIYVIVGNKSDLLQPLEVENDRNDEYEGTAWKSMTLAVAPSFLQDVREYSDTIGASYIETSAKDGSNVNELFQMIAQQASDKGLLVPEEPEQIGVDLSSRASKASCCS